jgi:hypothetical protein
MVYRCSPRQILHYVQVLATSSTTYEYCAGARHVRYRIVCQCSPRHPHYGALVLAASYTALCAGARHVIYHIRVVYRCSPRHPPHGVPVLATSDTHCVPVRATSTTTSEKCTGARNVIHHIVRIVYRCPHDLHHNLAFFFIVSAHRRKHVHGPSFGGEPGSAPAVVVSSELGVTRDAWEER